MTRKQDERDATPAEQQPGGDSRPDLIDPATAKFRRADTDEALTTTREDLPPTPKADEREVHTPGPEADPNGANRRKKNEGIPHHEESSDETPS